MKNRYSPEYADLKAIPMGLRPDIISETRWVKTDMIHEIIRNAKKHSRSVSRELDRYIIDKVLENQFKFVFETEMFDAWFLSKGMHDHIFIFVPAEMLDRVLFDFKDIEEIADTYTIRQWIHQTKTEKEIKQITEDLGDENLDNFGYVFSTSLYFEQGAQSEAED